MIGTYGHGTENDFVLVFDPENKLEFSPEQVARICDRKSGIGSDGLIKIIKRDGVWFMDYRNRDGSLAEMCGNGIRVMARYLVDRGHQSSGIFPINTRSGKKFLSVPPVGDITVNMGQIAIEPGEIRSENLEVKNLGLKVDVGNPHVVFFVDSLTAIGDLHAPPELQPDFPDGVNVEFVQFLDNGEIKMRVFERGVGETRSCGTGVCAVALAATLKKNKKLPSKWVINPPGGRLEVEIDPHSNATLKGPAILIKEVELDSYL